MAIAYPSCGRYVFSSLCRGLLRAESQGKTEIENNSENVDTWPKVCSCRCSDQWHPRQHEQDAKPLIRSSAPYFVFAIYVQALFTTTDVQSNGLYSRHIQRHIQQETELAVSSCRKHPTRKACY